MLLITALAFTTASHAQNPNAGIKPPSARLLRAEQSFNETEGHPDQNLAVFIEEADSGSAAAKRDLGLIYNQPYLYYPAAPEMALQWFEAAAVAGDTRAPSYIGDFYLDSNNGPIDPANALYWYEKGSRDHDARSTLALAGLYCNATGVKRDLPLCGRLLHQATAQRRPADPPDVKISLQRADIALADRYHQGNTTPINQKAAEVWYAAAAALGSVPGAIDQAMLYTRKPGLRQDLPRALAILDALKGAYTRAETHTVLAAYIAVGNAYEAHGKRDLSAAAAVYTKVALTFNENAPLLALVQRYIHGTGVPVNADRAYALLTPLLKPYSYNNENDLLYQACKDLANLYSKAKPPNLKRAIELANYRNRRVAPPVIAAAETAAAPQPMAERYPNLSAPDTVAPQQQFEVDVSLNAIQYDQNTQVLSGQQDAANGMLQITLPDGMTSMPIQVDLILPSGITFANGSNNSSTLTLDSTKPNSTVAIFNVIAGSAPVSGLIRATLSYHQNFIAQIGRPIAVVAAPTSPTTTTITPAPVSSQPPPAKPAADTTDTTSRSDNGPLVQRAVIKPGAPIQTSSTPPRPSVTLPAPLPKPSPIVIDPTAKSTDLTITETLNGDVMHYNFQSPALVGASDADVPNAAATRAAVQQMLDTLQSQSINVLSAGGASSDVALCTAAHAKGTSVGDKDPSCADSLQARAIAQGIGSKLYTDYAPPVFRTLYQLFITNHIRLHTITVVTNSPTLPWELMLPQPGTDNYLGLATAIVRENTASPQLAESTDIPFSSVAIVAPNYTGDKQLPAVLTEVKSIQTDFPAARLVPGDASDVSSLVRNDPASIIHYSGHGQLVPTAPNAPAELAPQAAIVLEDTSMTPDTFAAFRDQGSQDQHPFYFFNACDIGQSDRQLNYIEGWAPALMQSGASGYLGALYEVGDTSAASFAAHFYADLKQSLASHSALSTADIVMQARRQTYAEAYDPTALAYVLYAKPFMTLVADNQ